MKEGKDIELRSEAMQEVMGYVPAWIVRLGIMVLVLVMLALVVGGIPLSRCDRGGDEVDKSELGDGGRGAHFGGR